MQTQCNACLKQSYGQPLCPNSMLVEPLRDATEHLCVVLQPASITGAEGDAPPTAGPNRDTCRSAHSLRAARFYGADSAKALMLSSGGWMSCWHLVPIRAVTWGSCPVYERQGESPSGSLSLGTAHTACAPVSTPCPLVTQSLRLLDAASTYSPL